MKVAVISAMFVYNNNKTDDCGSFTKVNDFDYILFTNDKSLCKYNDLWDVREVDMNFTNGLFATKFVKWNTHILLPEYDIIIWVDSFININTVNTAYVKSLINTVHKGEVDIYIRTQTFKTVYEDIYWCLNNNRMTQERADILSAYLRDHGENIHTPCQTFWSSGMITNNKSEKIHEMGKELYDLLCNVSYRDQHWLPYIFKKHAIKSRIINNDAFINCGVQNRLNHNYVSIIDKSAPAARIRPAARKTPSIIRNSIMHLFKRKIIPPK